MKHLSKIFLFVTLLAAACAPALAQATGGAKGKVRTTRNVAIDGVKITARKDGKDIKTTTTDKNGAFELIGLEPGDYNLVFDKEGFNSGVFYNLEIKKNKIRDLGNRLVLRPDEGTQVIIRGIVFDRNGRSVRGANIEIQKKQPDGTYQTLRTTTSSYGAEPLATGEFVFRFPEQGATEFRVLATAKGVTTSKEISVNSAAVYRLALTLNLEQ